MLDDLPTKTKLEEMEEKVAKLDKKVDDLIDENTELRNELEGANSKLKMAEALNADLSKKNKELFDYAAERKAEAEAYKTILDKLKEGKE